MFIGPSPQTLRDMGDKTRAKALAKECGLPLVPGTDDAVASVEDAEKYVLEIGLPVILKAAMGGGGRGMRVVRNMSELAENFTRASSEAKARPARRCAALRTPAARSDPRSQLSAERNERNPPPSVSSLSV